MIERQAICAALNRAEVLLLTLRHDERPLVAGIPTRPHGTVGALVRKAEAEIEAALWMLREDRPPESSDAPTVVARTVELRDPTLIGKMSRDDV